MFRLRLLGGASIARGDGVPLAGRAAQRHRLALLALLACPPGHGLSRDKLIALLWPESDTERGRNLLNVSVYELRKALGEDALLSEGDELRLNAEAVSSDVAEFEGALERGDHEAAVALYRGPLLDGFFVPDAPEFERWANGERVRLAVAYARSLEALARDAEARGDFQGSAEWWRQRAAHDPYDSRVAQCLMRALDAGGNRAGALQHASVHDRLLQQELGLRAPSEVSALAERMRATPLARPSSVAPDVAVAEPPRPLRSPSDASVDPEPLLPPAVSIRPPRPESAERARGRWLRVGALALVAAAVVAALVFARRSAAPPSVPARSIAVLPFVNMSPDGDNEFFSDGVTEEIISHLSAVPTLKVISRTSAMRYKESTKSLRQIAEELGVTHVLEGSVRRERDTVRITAQLIDAGADLHLWSRSYDRAVGDVFAVQDEIAREVGRALEVELGEEGGVFAKRGTHDPQAYDLYRRGRFHWRDRTKKGHELAIQYYQRAIERDSSYAEPYAGLADAYLTAYQFNLSTMPEAEVYARQKWAAERALALDDRSADAHTSVAIALWWQRDWPGAERELRRAIELNPGSVTARGWYTLLLMGMGRVEEADQQSRRASELDPFSVLLLLNRAMVRYIARDFDGAIEHLRSALEINDSWAPAYAALSLAYAQKGMHDAATRAASMAVERGPQSTPFLADRFLADLAYAQALAGSNEEARRSLQRAKEMKVSEGFNIARAYVALGEPDSAFAWLQHSSWQWPHRATRGDPALDPLRSDPRFARLSARVAREMGMR